MKPELFYPFYPCLFLLSPPLTYLVIILGHLLFFFFLNFISFLLFDFYSMYVYPWTCMLDMCVCGYNNQTWIS